MIQKWNKIKKYLKEIDRSIPETIKDHNYYIDFKKFLLHNELQLSLESVFELILIHEIDRDNYWLIINNMNAASKEMELDSLTEEIEKIINHLKKEK